MMPFVLMLRYVMIFMVDCEAGYCTRLHLGCIVRIDHRVAWSLCVVHAHEFG
jgi:hypothetical protein